MEKDLLRKIVMISKRFFYGVFINCLLAGTLWAITGNAQEIKSIYQVHVKIKLQELDIPQVFNKIEDQTGLIFSFNKEDVKQSIQINSHFNEATVADVLLEISKQAHLNFKQINNNIHVTPKKAKEKGPNEIEVVLQGITITGKVISSEDGEGLPGVNVILKGTSQGSVTDVEGNYKLDVPDENSVLTFSSVGFVEEEVVVGNRSVIDIELIPDIETLSEVVVTALGIERPEDELGYATQRVKGEDLTLVTAPNIITSLSGKVAGVQIKNGDGVDGGSTHITIRGNNSINGNNQPMFVIDGIQIANDFPESGNFSTVGGSEAGGKDWGSSINNINSYDIESMDVLKGPAAAALYGARGANGVIIITTKKGSKTKGLGIEYTFNHRTTEVARFKEFQNVYGAGGPVMSNEIEPVLYKNGDGQFVMPQLWSGPDAMFSGSNGLGGRASWDDFSWYPSSVSWGPELKGQDVLWWDGEMRKWSPQPDNQKAGYQTGSNTEHNFSFSGGSDFGTVRVSLTNLNNTGVVPNTNYEQNTINLGSRLNISDKISSDISVSYMNYNRKNSPTLGDQQNSYGKQLLYSVQRQYKGLDNEIYENEDGSVNQDLNKITGYSYDKYRAWNVWHLNQYLDRQRILGSLSLNYDVTNWLSFLGRAGVDRIFEEFTTKQDPTLPDGLTYVPRSNKPYGKDIRRDGILNADFMAILKKDNIVDGLDLNLTLGTATWQRSKYEMRGGTVNTNSNPRAYPDQFTFYNVQDRTKNTLDEEFYEKQINSVYGLLNLSFKDYLFMEVTGRNDWSSTLPAESNSYFYPSVNLSFVASELFDMSSTPFNYLKGRLAFASTANDTKPYQVTPVYTVDSYGGASSFSLPDIVPAINLKPQLSSSYEAGVSLGMWEDRLTFDFTYYYIRSYDQILQATLPISSGAGQYVFNTGELTNNGIEVILGLRAINNNDFSWDVNLNFAHNKNFVVALDEDAKHLTLANLWGPYGPEVRVKPGEQYGTIYGYDYERDASGNKMVSDDGHHYVTTEERVPLGNATPDVIAGLINDFRYKNFSLMANIDASIGGDVFAGSYATALHAGLSPETLVERQGGGLPYTDSEGNVRNVGVILDGYHADGTKNEEVVHYIWKYMGNKGSAWGDRSILLNGEYTRSKFLHTEGVVDNTWVMFREVALSYDVPKNFLNKIGIQNLRLTVAGRNLFYIYQNMPDNINPEGMANVGNGMGVEMFSLPGTRSFSFGAHIGF